MTPYKVGRGKYLSDEEFHKRHKKIGNLGELVRARRDRLLAALDRLIAQREADRPAPEMAGYRDGYLRALRDARELVEMA